METCEAPRSQQVRVSTGRVWRVHHLFDQHNLISRWRTGQHIKQLKQEISHYENEIENNKRKMQELQSSDENLEKFAREQYLMKKKDEDIFIMGE